MKKNNRELSVKGGASSNLRACNLAHSDAHNLREGNTRTANHNPNLTIRPELKENNTVWMDESVPSLKELDTAIRKDFASVDHVKTVKDASGNPKEVVYHREMPSKGKTAASPVKESILNLPHNGKETDEMVEEFVRRWEQTFGVKCIRAFVHRDERYDDPDTGEPHFNCHAHLVWDFYDWQQHSLIKLKKDDLRLTEDWAAEITGMPRGTSATITNAKHLAVAEYKNKQERERSERIISEQKDRKHKADMEYGEYKMKLLKDVDIAVMEKQQQSQKEIESIKARSIQFLIDDCYDLQTKCSNQISHLDTLERGGVLTLEDKEIKRKAEIEEARSYATLSKQELIEKQKYLNILLQSMNEIIVSSMEKVEEKTDQAIADCKEAENASQNAQSALIAIQNELDERRRREREKLADKALAFIIGGQTKIEKENEQWKDNYNGLKDKYNDLAQRFKGLKRELTIKDERIEAEISERDELRKEYDNYIREQSGIKTKLQNEIATLKKEVSTWYGIVKDICKYIKAITDPGQQSMWKNWIDRYVKPEQMQTIEKDMQNEAKQQTQTSAHRYGRGI